MQKRECSMSAAGLAGVVAGDASQRSCRELRATSERDGVLAGARVPSAALILHKVLLKTICRSQLSHKSVIFSSTTSHIKNICQMISRAVAAASSAPLRVLSICRFRAWGLCWGVLLVLRCYLTENV